MNRIKGITIPIILLAATLFASFTATAAQNDEAVSARQTVSRQQIESYWTEARMKKARPVNMPVLAQPRGTGQGPVPQAAGSPFLAYSGGPGDQPVRITGSSAHSLLARSAEPTFGIFPFSYTRYRAFPDTKKIYKSFPYMAVGQLFFTIPTMGDFVCSGASINSANRSVVWTAGHCVGTPGIGFHNNFLFIPAKRNAKGAFGNWTSSTSFTTNGWLINNLFEYDHGALVMNRGGKLNQRIADIVGFLGFLANASRMQNFNIFGYPVAPRDLPTTPPGLQYDGLHQEICNATWAINDPPTTSADPAPIGVGCDQTGGSSGGPWFVDFSGVPGATNFINGNNSYKYGNQPLNIYSPYFTNGAINVLNAASAIPVP